MQLFHFFLFLIFQVQTPVDVKWIPESQELAVFVRGGLHTNHYWACDHTALVEVSEAKEKDRGSYDNAASFYQEAISLRFLPSFSLAILNPQKLQWTNLPLFVLLRNFRL